jgi:RNA polymerase sigma-70 factor (ECF subfamily)
MSDSPTEFERLMARVRAGDPRAAQEVYDRYSDHVRRVVRRRLHQLLRTQYDSVDFLQAVWASFFLVPPKRYAFTTPDELIAFLSQVAYHKVADVYRRRFQTDKQDIHRERRLGGDDSRCVDLPGRGPSPSQLAIAHEHWERLLQGQPPQNRRVLEMLRQGHTHREIAEQLDLHPKVIQRLLRKLTPKVEPP